MPRVEEIVENDQEELDDPVFDDPENHAYWGPAGSGLCLHCLGMMVVRVKMVRGSKTTHRYPRAVAGDKDEDYERSGEGFSCHEPAETYLGS